MGCAAISARRWVEPMSWWFVAAVGCAVLAGALVPRGPSRGLDRLHRRAGTAPVSRGIAAARALRAGSSTTAVGPVGEGLLFRARDGRTDPGPV